MCRVKVSAIAALLSVALLGPAAAGASTVNITRPLVASANPNYFKDASGAVIVLAGSHTWNTLQDWGSHGSPQPLDFDAFVSFLLAHGHNFTLLWAMELPRVCGLPSRRYWAPDLTVSPHPWQRTGPGIAADGGLKFDLTKFDQSYFDRLRTRTQILRNAGIYVGVYLFTGEFLKVFRCASDGYPFTGANNINGVDDGYEGGAKGIGAIAMNAPKAITAFQDAYVEKVIDTLNDLPNVLWIISEEAPKASVWWNSHQISHIKAYESTKPHQHPIGYGAPDTPDGTLYDSDADWVAPQIRISPATSCGTGDPTCKVNVNDSDHSYFGMWNDTPQQNRNYAWQNFMMGNQVLFMDPYTLYYPREGRNQCVSPIKAICSGPDPRWDNFRQNLGYILRYSRKVNLAKVTPRGSLCSTGYCLAQTPDKGAEYLVYAPSGGLFTVDLSAMPSSRTLAVEWFNPTTGLTIAGEPIHSGSSSQSFTPPFGGDAVLYLTDTAGHAAGNPRQP
jgi:Putative collagen-binding domain of a collagenase